MKQGRLGRSDVIFAYCSVLPVVAVIVLIKGYPLINAVMYSFTNWDGMSKNDFIGMANYVNLLTGSEFWMLIRNSATLLIYIPLQIVLGLLMAVLLYEKVPGWRPLRTIYYLPQIISLVVIGYLFAIIFSYDGAVNAVLESIGLGALKAEWLGDASTSMPIIIFCLVWMNIGWQALIFSGGLSSIDDSIVEAAKLDGAGYMTRLFRILLPILGRTVEYSVVTCVIWVFTGIFPIIFTMTHGGPGYSTTTIDFMIYTLSFSQGRMGVACALSMILTVFIIIITRIEMSLSDRSNDWAE